MDTHSSPLSGSRTVLIVDDNPVDRDTYKAFLTEYTDCTFSFFEAEDADEALKLCHSLHIDCMLLDFELPDVDGLELMDQLRDSAGRICPPVVMVTGRGSETIAVQAIRKGAMDYVVKSEASPANLLRAIINAIDRTDSVRLLSKEKADRAEIEQGLRQSEEKFRLLVNSVSDYAIIMMDPDGRVVSWNLGARRLLDYSGREILGQHIRLIYTPEDSSAKVPEADLKGANAGSSVSDDRWHVKKGGERFWANGVVTAITDEHQVLRGYAKVLHDVTEKMRAESMLKNALASRDEFLSIASHELKTPLTALKFQVQSMLRFVERQAVLASPDAVDLAEWAQALSRTNRQVTRLSHLVENLLNASRLTPNELSRENQALCLSQLLDTMIERLRPVMHRCGIEVTVQQVPDSVWVMAVAQLLQQVLDNLFSNAMKYAPGKPVTIRLRRQGRQIELSIQDQGPGLAPGQQTRIFQRYRREADPSDASGMGLGLYVSRKLMEAMGGSLWLHSVIGQGTTFFIRLPLTAEADDGR